MCCKITRDKTLNTVSLPAKEQSLQKKKFVPSVEMLPEVTQRDLNVEAWVAFQALLEDRLERTTKEKEMLMSQDDLNNNGGRCQAWHIQK